MSHGYLYSFARSSVCNQTCLALEEVPGAESVPVTSYNSEEEIHGNRRVCTVDVRVPRLPELGRERGCDREENSEEKEKDEVEVSPETTLLHKLKAEESKVADCMVSLTSSSHECVPFP